MHVLQVSPMYFSSSKIGGGERYPIELAKALSRHCRTTFLSFGASDETGKIGDLDFRIMRRARNFPGSKNNPIPEFNILVDLIKQADVVHCHHLRYFASESSVILSRIYGRPVAVTDHGGGQRSLSTLFPVRSLATHFLTVSAFGGRMLGAPPEKVTPIYGGVDIEKFWPSAPKTVGPTVLFVGRLLPHKGIDILIDALPEGMELRIAGRPNHAEYFSVLRQKAVSKRVTFITDADDAQLRNEYSQATVTILPSVYRDFYGASHDQPELLGLTLLESMACGTPVIASDVGGMPEVVPSHVGHVVTPGSVSDLHALLKDVLSRPDVYHQMGEAAVRYVRCEFTWDAVARRAVRWYQTVCNKR